jgi:hypothetical protein
MTHIVNKFIYFGAYIVQRPIGNECASNWNGE